MSTDLRLVVTHRPQLGQWRRSLVRQLARQAERAVTTLLRWHELARQRRELMRLDDTMLKDIGLTRADALREAERPFWDEGRQSWQSWR
jgi:uncharacterized protein YjiS (DUF1127 family)